ncbi:hypothetical protein SNE35_12100 [Paucibacter sp. R3-3]|uniref:Intracellular septation protein A n=1 Tax=Roseateles agri TaxID=3098619 RepID=A0ABU5DGI2_9BURK|nr:hypothetical protein [Paucibacter sp. R3-3]MDY0745254.1 hypothetical protein [Paucibacter sp. R3-3]
MKSLLLAFAPFIAFAGLERIAGIVPGLLAAAALSLALVVRDALTAGRHAKLLELGSAALFGGLAVCALGTDAGGWSVLGVRLAVDIIGLCAIVAMSLLLNRPFTLPYARERVPEAVWATPRFLRANRVLSAVWLAAFAVLVAADALMLYVPALPLAVGVALSIAALVGAFKFSRWYPKHLSSRELV